MKKFILDLTVTENLRLHTNYVLLKLTSQTVSRKCYRDSLRKFG